MMMKNSIYHHQKGGTRFLTEEDEGDMIYPKIEMISPNGWAV
jgi:hypothetical protein